MPSAGVFVRWFMALGGVIVSQSGIISFKLCVLYTDILMWFVYIISGKYKIVGLHKHYKKKTISLTFTDIPNPLPNSRASLSPIKRPSCITQASLEK